MLIIDIYSLPIAHFVLFTVTILVTYTISVYYKHVYPTWPYISDTGVISPERCIISQLFTIGCVLSFLGALGISVTSNFSRKADWNLHLVGVVMAFGLENVYKIVQIILSITLYPEIGSKLIIGTRIAITSMFNTCIICSAICGRISLMQFNGTNVLQWLPEHAGFTLHIISTVTGWIAAILTLVFLLTYAYEFKDILIYKSVFEISEKVANVH